MFSVPGTCPFANSAAGRASITRLLLAVWASASSMIRGIGRSSTSGGPSLLSRFIIAKYGGGSGWPDSTLATKSASDFVVKAQLKSRS